MFVIGIYIGVIIGFYISIGFKLAIDNLQVTPDPTTRDRLGAIFIMFFWLPLFIFGMLFHFYDYIKEG